MPNGGSEHAIEECFSEISSVELEAEPVQVALKIFGLYIVKNIEDCPLGVADRYMHPRKYLSNLFFRYHLRVMLFEHLVEVGVGG